MSFRQSLTAVVERDAKLAREALTRGAELKLERTNLIKQCENLADAIAQLGNSPVLSAKLSGAETRLDQIEQLLRTPDKSQVPTFSKEEIEDFFGRQSQRLADVLVADVSVARQELQKRIAKLVLMPKETANGPVFEVTGDIELFSGNGDVIQNNSLEGIAQHYAPHRITLANIVLDPSLPIAA